jgi:hypothetical protein
MDDLLAQAEEIQEERIRETIEIEEMKFRNT